MDQQQMPNLPVEYTISPRAKKALKGKWPTALMVAFGAGIINTLFQVAYTIAVNPAMEMMNTQLQKGYPQEYALQVFWQSVLGVPLYVPALAVLAFLLTPVLNMGYRAYCFKLLRGEEGTFNDLFSRMGLFLKSIGQTLMIALRTFLWMLVGIVPTVGIVVAMGFMGMNYMNLISTALVLSLLASIPGLVAMYRYMLAPFAMADDPTMGINASIRMSAQLMKKRKLRLLGLTIGWSLLSQIGSSILQTMLGSVVGLALSMLVSLACSVVVQMITANYYLTYRQVDGI